MKKIFTLLMVCLTMLACEPEQIEQQDFIQASKMDVAVPAVASTIRVNVSASGEWNYSADVEWLLLDRLENSLTIEVEANTAEEREATITLTCGEATSYINLYQADGTVIIEDEITVANMEVMVPADSTTLTVGVSANGEWSATSDSDWCVVSTSDSGVVLTVAANTAAERTANITLTSGKASATIVVTQADGTIEDEISVANIAFTMPANASTLLVKVTANGEWTATSDASWCKAECTAEGLLLTLEANASELRTANITLTSGEATTSITLSQEADGSIEVAPTELTFDAAGGSLNVAVNTIIKWSVKTTDKWITPTVDGDIITITAKANDTADARQGVVEVHYVDSETKLPSVIEIGVSQASLVEVSTDAIEFAADQTTAKFTIKASGDWTATPSMAGASWLNGIVPSWLTVSQSEGSAGETEITVNIQKSYMEREAAINVKVGKVTKQVAITQKAMPSPVTGKTVRVMTWNQNVKGNKDIADVILNNNLDFVALQEVDVKTGRSGGVDQIESLKKLTGYEGAYFCKTINFDGGEYGIGILSKKAAISTRFVDLQGSESRKLFIAEYDDFVFASTHYSYSGESQMRIDHLASAKITVNELSKYTDKTIVLGGDFNTETDIDKRQTHGHLMTLMDLIIDPTMMTWPGTLPAGEMYLLDFLFVKSVTPYVWTDGGYINKTVSDHCPVWAELRFFEE
ncbi:MAG: endonuclease/exonuclease/phosphatase family protein [Rikenellaceae bacterium]|nr:endonuclease/exonuclease/phosphatase family protein [Rikenellaceae bacterium]